MRVVVGLGSNEGDRLGFLRKAFEAIRDRAHLVGASPIYETEPIGGPSQGAFLNGAVLVDWNEEPLSLLDALLAIELDLGRVRDVRWGPRTIDLDILWIEGTVIDDPRLTVPHPRLVARAFALFPLLDLVPSAINPRTAAAFARPCAEGVRRTSLGW